MGLAVTRRRKATLPLEHQEQVTLLEWFDLQYPALRKRMAAVPNAGKMNATIGKRMNGAARATLTCSCWCRTMGITG